MDLTLDVASVHVTAAYNTKQVQVELQGADQSDILVNFSTKDILSHFEIKDLLDQIGENECKVYFDLINKE